MAVISKKLSLIGIGKECMGPFPMVGETIVSHWTAATCHKSRHSLPAPLGALGLEVIDHDKEAVMLH